MNKIFWKLAKNWNVLIIQGLRYIYIFDLPFEWMIIEWKISNC